MRTTFEDIKGKLDNSLYKNEEQIRFSLVARVLEKLDWKIWDPQEVATEFSPNNGSTKSILHYSLPNMKYQSILRSRLLLN